MTKFQILAAEGSPGLWEEHSTEEAHNASEAVRKAYLKKPESSRPITAMVAVPARSWKPTPIRTETVTKVVLGMPDAGDAPEAPRGKDAIGA